MTFRINGSAASLAPMKQQWTDIIIGQNLYGESIYSAYKEVRLEFDSCELVHYKQWENAVTGGSWHTITILAKDAITYTAFSGVVVDFDKRPTFESGHAEGPWSLKVREVKQS